MDPYDYAVKYKKLINKERDAEKEFHTGEIKSLKPEIREKKGRCLTRMIKQTTKSESESIFRFVKSNNTDLPHNEFSIGTNVLISIKNPLDHALSGVVISKSAKYIDIYVESQSNIINSDNLRIDVYVNDYTFNVQKDILDKIKDWSFEKGHLRDVLLNNDDPKQGERVNIELFDLSLNQSQKNAVNQSLIEQDLYLIQGPPGTGKTKTSIEIIRQHLKFGKSVLVSADSNMAVDNIMLGLIKNVDVIRVGESPKIMDEIQEHTLANVIKTNFQYRIVDQGLSKIRELRELQRKETFPSKSAAKGVSYFQIKKFAERRQSAFGISLEKIESMARWISSQERIKEIQARIDKMKEKIIKEAVKSASVICCTNTNAASRYLEDLEFDLVLIDEAGQSTEPSCLIPISKGKKLILVGDHKQLPPTILSQDAQELSISLFERMMDNPKCNHTLLDTQYRMHPEINQFPSDEFYGSELKSHFTTENKGLKDGFFGKNVVFIENTGLEHIHKGATSYSNESEADLVFELVLQYKKRGLSAEDIGIISPYINQVKMIKDRMPFVEVNTIDGFQGREKNVIVISLVRSNDKGNIGFLKDLRRLNVALTRAINELIVIGNPNTISSNDTYKRFLDYVKKHGIYLTQQDAKKKLS